MTTLAVIPARYASTRFPGKPLALIANKPMIWHVWQRTRQASKIDDVVIATDDARIMDACRSMNMPAIMTSTDHVTGTDRMAEVAAKQPADIYVNVQGDEPLISPATIDSVVHCLQDGLRRGIEVATCYLEGATPEQEASTSAVHLVPTLDGKVMTLSRLPVPCAFKAPFRRNIHVGIYTFSRDALKKFAARKIGPVEASESIEILRFLEYGDSVACFPITEPSIGVDHPEDIAKVEALMARARQSS